MKVEIWPLEGLPEIRPGDDLGEILFPLLGELKLGDILVLAQKVVSKSEGRLVALDSVRPGPEALDIAERWQKDPRLVELVLQESKELLRQERGVLISRTHRGYVCANAGIDLSNVDGGKTACLLPKDCDASARTLHQRLSAALGFALPVLISDSFGRPWRLGITNVALGSAGLETLVDLRGQCDSHGLTMQATVLAVADSLAAATDLVVGKSDGSGAVIIRGYPYRADNQADVQKTLRPWNATFFR